MLPDLGVTHALLLQGPAGPFMRRFADELEGEGIRATKVNFHAGDVFFFPGPRAVSYRGPMDDFEGWVGRLMEDLGVDGIFLFGDCRPLHRMAIRAAEARGAKIWVFEEGYLRPDWITLEEHGVNGHSRMPRDPDFYRSLDLPEPPPPQPVGASFHLNSWYSTFNALAFTHLNDGFPHYEHHRILNAWYHTFVWCRNVVRKKKYAIEERHIEPELVDRWAGRYFFVPLQVYCDFQLLHSPYDDVLEFVREITASFTEHADPGDAIVFKHHPMDRAYREYHDFFRDLAREHGIEDRLVYCHDQHLPTLLKNAKGTITINSTVGLSSIHHQTPVKVMGTAVYDMPGLTYQGALADFFREQPKPDRELYEQYRRYLLETNQANGSFYRPLDGVDTPTGIRWFPARIRGGSRVDERIGGRSTGR